MVILYEPWTNDYLKWEWVMFENILTDVQRKELESLLEDYNNIQTRHLFWSQFEKWLFDYLKNYLSGIFKHSLNMSLKNLQEKEFNSSVDRSNNITTIH